MKIMLTGVQLERIIEKHYEEELDFKGNASVNVYDQDDYYRGGKKVFQATMRGKIKLDGQDLAVKYEINEEEIKKIIKRYFEKAGYQYVNAHMGCKQQHCDAFERDAPYLTFDNVEVEVKEKVKEKVVNIE